jgi:Tfp pilus assembly protein PilN
MSALAAEMGGRYERAVAAVSGFDPVPPWVRTGRRGRPRWLIECVAAVVAGAGVALGCAALAPADSNMTTRRERLEREWASLSAPLAEYARLERAGQGAHASAVLAAARARPLVELRLLLETLSREAPAGVTVRRLRQSRDGFEMQVRAADGAACASWVARLARVPGWEGADMVDLRLVAAAKGLPAGRTVEATVRVPSRAAGSALESRSESAKPRAVRDSGEAGGRRAR